MNLRATLPLSDQARSNIRTEIRSTNLLQSFLLPFVKEARNNLITGQTFEGIAFENSPQPC